MCTFSIKADAVLLLTLLIISKDNTHGGLSAYRIPVVELRHKNMLRVLGVFLMGCTVFTTYIALYLPCELHRWVYVSCNVFCTCVAQHIVEGLECAPSKWDMPYSYMIVKDQKSHSMCEQYTLQTMLACKCAACHVNTVALIHKPTSWKACGGLRVPKMVSIVVWCLHRDFQFVYALMLCFY